MQTQALFKCIWLLSIFDLIWFDFCFILFCIRTNMEGTAVKKTEKPNRRLLKVLFLWKTPKQIKTNQNMLSQVKSSRGVRCWKYNHPLMPEIIICFHHILMYMSILLSVYIDYTKFLHCCLSWCVPSWSSNYKNSLSYNKDPTDSIRENNLVGL